MRKPRSRIVYVEESAFAAPCGAWEGEPLYTYTVKATLTEVLPEFVVEECQRHWIVTRPGFINTATYSKDQHPDAEAAARAECARLNEMAERGEIPTAEGADG